MTKRILGIGIIIIAMYLGLGEVALAGYPHGEFADNTDACAACHRAHTAISANLLAAATGSALCNSCHWGAIGADTDVKNGVYNVGGEPDLEWGDPNGVLLGGGFDFVAGQVTTSQHNLGVSLMTPGEDTRAEMVIVCTSCHTPHMDRDNQDQYRLLRTRPNGIPEVDVPWNGPYTDDTQTEKKVGTGGYRAYTEKDFDPTTPGVQYYTNNYKDNIDEWCIACHTRYRIRGDAGGLAGDNYDAGDIYGTVPRFRHATDLPIKGQVDPFNGLSYDMVTDLPLEDYEGDGRDYRDDLGGYDDDKMTCITCHRSHGTEAKMEGFADFAHSLYGGDRGELPTNSMHLRTNNRGVCVQCHTMGTL